MIAPLLGHAVADLEGRVAGRRDVSNFDAFDTRQRWGFLFQVAHERRQRGCWAFDLDLHPAGVVEHPAGQAMFVRQTVDEGPEADPLHYAAHADRLPHQPA